MTFKIFKKRANNIRNRHFLYLDIIIVALSPLIALFIRMEGNIPAKFLGMEFLLLILILGITKISIFYLFGLYKRFWKSASMDDYIKLISAGITILVVETFFIYSSRLFEFEIFGAFPLSLPILDGLISHSFVSISRFGIRIIDNVNQYAKSKKSNTNVLIIGAGQTGQLVRDELLLHPASGRVVGFLDDDNSKIGLKINGTEVLGTTSEIEYYVEKKHVSKIILAIAGSSGKKIKEIHQQCSNLNLELLTIPSLYSIISNKISISRIQKVRLEDLLRREAVQTNTDNLINLIKGKNVFISGAGGSIGSEICRQVMKFKPNKLILFGKGENSIYEIQQEICDAVENAEEILVPVIGDVRNRNRLDAIFKKFKPDLVFHAAAHKHVPLMEMNIEEALTNNVMGTKNVVELSSIYGVENFILISTDKAVNPKSIMGVSKRICEMVVLNEAKKSGLAYSIVRFGNVLGSRGSVVKTFEKQIASGGPLTVTDKEMKRYFMTIPEATQLVLQAAFLNKGGEIYVLNMGKPVRIYDLALDMIQFSGLRYKEDIDIVITKNRPGEKLFEELFLESENYTKTENKLIYIVADAIKEVDPLFEVDLSKLLSMVLMKKNDSIDYSFYLKKIVPEFQYSNNELVVSA